MRYLLFTLCFIPMALQAQDTIRIGHRFKHFNQLELGVKKDVIYNIMNGKTLRLAMKTRSTELVTLDGQQYVSIKHAWEAPGTKWKGEFTYLCEPETMKPVQHIRVTETAGKEAFQFTGSQVVGLDSANNNTKASFSLELDEPTYNFEIDLETYSLLPMKAGYHAVMNFYHPGGKTPPKWYHLKVTGSEKLNMPDGRQMDCWVLFTDYGGTQPTQFWYTKKGQNFVKMEGNFGQMTIRKERIF